MNKISRKSFLRIMGVIFPSIKLMGYYNVIGQDSEKGIKELFVNSIKSTNRSIKDKFGIIQTKASDKSTPTNTSTYWLQFTDASNSLYHHIANQAYNLLEKRKREINQITSLAQWQDRQRMITENLLNAIGPLPSKTPLKARITKGIKKKGFKVENIIYESRPNFYVSSSLFIPNNLTEPGPAIIYTSGHGGLGYRYSLYQHTILNLVKKGFIVLAFDPIGQGERREYSEESGVRGTTKEHSYSGGQSFIIGQTMAQYMIWDGIRAIDYLLTRKEVDPTRIGITGRSGGGCQAAYIGAIDERIYACAPECYITSFERLFQSIGPQDGEQNLISQLAKGIDHADYLVVRAPKPTLVITTTRDIFSIQGARETAQEVANIYHAYDKRDHFSMVEDDAEHESTVKNREAMYAFFQEHLDKPGCSADEEVELLSQPELMVTRTGQMESSLRGETTFTLNRREAINHLEKLDNSRKNIDQHLIKVVKAAKELSGFHQPYITEDPVFTGRFQKKGYVVERYFVKGEGNYPLPYILMIPDNANHKALIYLIPKDKSAHSQKLKWFVNNGFTVLVPDLLGFGELGGGDFKGDSYIDKTSYNMWFASILIGRSIVGTQASDVALLSHLLYKKNEIKKVIGLAYHQMGPILLHAAAFDPSITRIALMESYVSYRTIAVNKFYYPGFIISWVAGALKNYDLPDLAASLAPRKLLLGGISDELGESLDLNSINEELNIVFSSYKHNSATNNLKILPSISDQNLKHVFGDWID